MSSTKISQGNRKKYKTKRKFAKVFQNTKFLVEQQTRNCISSSNFAAKNSTISPGKILDIKHKTRCKIFHDFLTFIFFYDFHFCCVLFDLIFSAHLISLHLLWSTTVKMFSHLLMKIAYWTARARFSTKDFMWCRSSSSARTVLLSLIRYGNFASSRRLYFID